MSSIMGFAGQLVAWPLRWLTTRLLRRGGEAVVLDLVVEGIEELAERQLWLESLRRVGEDPLVAGVWLRLREPPGGWAMCEDLRRELVALRKQGKVVVASVEAPGNALMWLASACDRVFLVPTGEVALVGVGIELTFFGGLLERLGLIPDLEAAGEYKSFGESWTRSFASRANQEAMGALVQGLHEQLVADIARGRALTEEEVQHLLAQAPLSAEHALSAGLVDQLAYEDQVEEWLKERHGARWRRVSLSTWARSDALLQGLDRLGQAGPRVAVLHLQGPIVMDAKGPKTAIGARQVVPVLRKLRVDDDVAAVVLHVHSPGGSALASDMMWREVDALRRDKPVVASFEDVAASGGFYLAAPAQEIVARDSSLTGSIGVFGGKLVAAEGLARVGVHSQQVLSAPNANLFSPGRPFTEAQRARFRASLQRIYDGFVSRVAEGRQRPVEEVEPACRGRVWTGKHALEQCLLDRLGGLDLALSRARALAGLHEQDCPHRHLTVQQGNPWVRWLRGQLREASPLGLRSLAWLGRGHETVSWLAEHQGQALMWTPLEVGPPS